MVYSNRTLTLSATPHFMPNSISPREALLCLVHELMPKKASSIFGWISQQQLPYRTPNENQKLNSRSAENGCTCKTAVLGHGTFPRCHTGWRLRKQSILLHLWGWIGTLPYRNPSTALNKKSVSERLEHISNNTHIQHAVKGQNCKAVLFATFDTMN